VAVVNELGLVAACVGQILAIAIEGIGVAGLVRLVGGAERLSDLGELAGEVVAILGDPVRTVAALGSESAG